MNMRTPLSRAHGLGAAKEGVAHWWMQRVTSVALVPLALWFGFSLSNMADFSRAEVLAWMREPLTTVLLLAFLVVGCYHMALGLRVIIEDYVHVAALKVTIIVLVELGSLLLALAGVVSVLRAHF